MTQSTNWPGPIAHYDAPAWIVTAVGLCLGLIGLAYLLTHPEPLAIWVVEGVLVIVPAAVIVYSGYWIAHSLDRADRWIVANWTVSGAIIAVAFVAGYVLSEQFSGGLVTEPEQLILFGAVGGSLIALLAAISIQRRFHGPDIASPDEVVADENVADLNDFMDDPLDDPFASLAIGFWTGLLAGILVMAAILIALRLIVLL